MDERRRPTGGDLGRAHTRDSAPGPDWEAVRRVAAGGTSVRNGGQFLDDERRALHASYLALVIEAMPWVTETCGGVAFPVPRVRVVDRQEFIGLHITRMRRLTATLPAAGVLTLPVRAISDQFVGRQLRAMSRQVLGQYDPGLGLPGEGQAQDEPALYIVENNMPRMGAGGCSLEPVRRWVIFHELAHAWQFETHPWLARYITRQQLLTLAAGHSPLLQVPGAIGRGLRGGVRLQAAMSLIEGHATFVEHRVGQGHLPEAAAVDRGVGSSPHPSLERLVFALSGGGMKLRQYRSGQKFVERVAQIGGVDLVNRAWTRPWTLPTILELSEPDRWDARMTSSTG